MLNMPHMPCSFGIEASSPRSRKTLASIMDSLAPPVITDGLSPSLPRPRFCNLRFLQAAAKDPKLYMIKWLAERCNDDQLEKGGLERKSRLATDLVTQLFAGSTVAFGSCQSCR